MTDPYSFHVQVSGFEGDRFRFTKCSGISASIDNQEYRLVGARQIPAQVTDDPITLSYGVTDSRALWEWLVRAAEGKVERRNVTIYVLDVDGQTPPTGWKLTNAWPQKWQGTELDADSGQIAIAQLTLVYEVLQRI